MRILKIFLMLLIPIILGSTVMADVKFKTNRIKKEFKQLYYKNIKLYQIVMEIDYDVDSFFKKNTVITEIYRTQREQDRYYKGKRKFKSPHQRWLAVDIRTRHLNNKEIKAIVDGVNNKYNSTNTYIPTAFYHDIGLGPHIHIQFKERK